MLYSEIKIKWVHPILNIGLQDVRNAWLLTPEPVKLSVGIHQGAITYRFPKTQRRISYRQLKKGLQKENRTVKLPYTQLPF